MYKLRTLHYSDRYLGHSDLDLYREISMPKQTTVSEAKRIFIQDKYRYILNELNKYSNKDRVILLHDHIAAIKSKDIIINLINYDKLIT